MLAVVKKSMSFLVVLLVLSSVVFAQEAFVDVNSSHWAYNYISKVVNLGIMDVYEDNTFRPEEALSPIDVLSCVTRLFEISDNEMSRLREKYEDQLNGYNLSSKEKDVVAIALDKELVRVDEIPTIVGRDNKATKLEASVYIAKAMGIKEKDAGKVFVFLYNDVSKIPKDSMVYIDFLIQKGVLNQKGDGNGNFNPDEPVTRAVLARMLSEAYNEIKGVTVLVVEEEDLIEDRGHIKAILIAQRPAVVIEREDKTKATYFLSENASITLNGKAMDIYGLRLGNLVKVKIKGENIISMEVK